MQGTEKKFKYPILPGRAKRLITACVMFLLTLILVLSFFGGAGRGGNLIFKAMYFLMGRAVFFAPVFFCLAGIIFIKPSKKRIYLPVFLAAFLLTLGVAGIFSAFEISSGEMPSIFAPFTTNPGGLAGYLIAFPLLRYFGMIVSLLIFCALVLSGSVIILEFLPKKQQPAKEAEQKKEGLAGQEQAGGGEKGLKFEIKELGQKLTRGKAEGASLKEGFAAGESQFPGAAKTNNFKLKYQSPPLEFLENDKEKAMAGDVETNSLIIKKTLENFGIPVEMSEVNIGPTVTQYTLKPAEGVKLSKITALKNDLSLALASHPLRIEAPIPGRSLVGVEVPNKTRAQVRLRELIAIPDFQTAPSLAFCLGRDVKGGPVFAELGRMPHLLVAGATGTGKTIALNSLILSLIWRSSPQILKLILIDPKRVEFPVYNPLPHLLTPVILNAQKTLNALNWLTGEMDRRFDILGAAKARNIGDFNESLLLNPRMKKEGLELMPYIVLIIDELADLMAQKGREIEAAVVRIAQMARAVGIHLVLATQRPSVEVITGLIKANITSRIAFQVASQIDSRTILDTAGAEALLGRGDMLFISSESSRVKRIQGVYTSLGEVKRVVKFCQKESGLLPGHVSELQESLARELEEEKGHFVSGVSAGEDPLYEQAKRVVMEAGKASASLLQRRLQIGYARAARILDILEERGVIGPQDGAKPRKVYLKDNNVQGDSNIQGDGEDWEKV